MNRMDPMDPPPAPENVQGGGEPRWLCLLLAAAALLTAFSFAFTPLRSSQDEWWHLKAGKWIVENRRLPEFDIFTYTGEQIPWHNHEWLCQVLFYSVYAWGDERAVGGVRALIAFKALIVVGVFALAGWLAHRRGGSWIVAWLLALVAADVSRRTIYPRPPVVSYVFFAAALIVMHEWKAGRMRARWLLALPLAAALWANLHGMCILAVAVSGCYFAGEMVEAGLAWWRLRSARRNGAAPATGDASDTGPLALHVRNAVLLAALTAVTILAAMASPSGYHVFFLGSRFAADPILRQVIAEMLPPPLPLRHVAGPDGAAQLVFIPGFASCWLAAAAFLALFAWRRGRLPHAADYFVIFFFLYQGLLHWRLLPLFAIAWVGPMAWLISPALSGAAARYLRPALATLAAALAFAFVFLIGEPPPETFFRRNIDLLRGKAMEPADYPNAVMKFIIRARLPGRMFSEINYCGYPIWWLSPEHHKLFTDNRFDVFGSHFYMQAATITEGLERDEAAIGKGWSGLLDEHGVNFVLISRGAGLNAKLRASGGWAQVYYWIPEGGRREQGFNVWVRTDPRFAETIDRARGLFRQERPGWPLPEWDGAQEKGPDGGDQAEQAAL